MISWAFGSTTRSSGDVDKIGAHAGRQLVGAHAFPRGKALAIRFIEHEAGNIDAAHIADLGRFRRAAARRQAAAAGERAARQFQLHMLRQQGLHWRQGQLFQVQLRIDGADENRRTRNCRRAGGGIGRGDADGDWR